MPKNKFDQAILTRCSKFDISMNKQEKIERLQWIIDTKEEDFRMNVPMAKKQESLDFIKENIDRISNSVLSVRTLNEVIDYAMDEENEDWKDVALYSMLF